MKNFRIVGYTLIEVLVGITIVSLLFVGGYTAYRDFARRQVLTAAADTLKSNLDLARQKASSAEKPAGCTNVLSGYEVTFTNTTYTIAPKCDITQPSSSFTLIYLLSSSVTLTASGFSPTLLYKTVGGTNLSSNATITLTHASGATKVLTVSPEGLVQ